MTKEEALGPILKDTYGVLVYQEQIMSIAKTLAGYSGGEADNLRRIMSKKNVEAMEEQRPKFLAGCVAYGLSEKDATEIFDAMIKFAKYAFNKSHSVAYAITGYKCAWLKAYYPAEFLAACLNQEKKPEKIKGVIADAHHNKVCVLPPDVNRSEAKCVPRYVDGKKTIVYGLSYIRDVGKAGDMVIAERNANGPYQSLADFMLRINADGLTKQLIKAGAFDCFGKARSQYMPDTKLYQTLEKSVGIVRDKRAFINAAEKAIALLKTVATLDEFESALKENGVKFALNSSKASRSLPTVSSIRKRCDTAKKAIETNLATINDLMADLEASMPEAPMEVLEKEREVLGVYLTDSPLNHVEITTNPISMLQVGVTSVSGFVSDFSLTPTKKGTPRCTFTLEDETSSVPVTIYYDGDAVKTAWVEALHNGSCIELKGKFVPDNSYQGDEEDAGEEDEEMHFRCSAVYEITELRPKKERIRLCTTLVRFLEEVEPLLADAKDDNGTECEFEDLTTGLVQKLAYRVEQDTAKKIALILQKEL